MGVARPAAFAPADRDDKQSERVIAFGIVATLFFGLCYMLALHRVLEPSPSSVLKELTNAKFPDQEARILVGSRLFGAVPSDWKKTSN